MIIKLPIVIFNTLNQPKIKVIKHPLSRVLFYARIIDMRKLSRVAVGLTSVLLAFSAFPASAFDPNAVKHKTLNDNYIGAISQNCSSIKVRLQRIQKDDARNRVHLGAQYETIANSLMLNLNLRLIKNNLASAELTKLQTSFVSEQKRFKDDYIGYSQELENVLKIDCRTEPTKFYYQLEIVRAKRDDVDASMRRLRGLITEHRELVVKTKGEL